MILGHFIGSLAEIPFRFLCNALPTKKAYAEPICYGLGKVLHEGIVEPAMNAVIRARVQENKLYDDISSLPTEAYEHVINISKPHLVYEVILGYIPTKACESFLNPALEDSWVQFTICEFIGFGGSTIADLTAHHVENLFDYSNELVDNKEL